MIAKLLVYILFDKSVSQLYGKDSEYAAAINASTTIGCIVTMPLVKIVE